MTNLKAKLTECNLHFWVFGSSTGLVLGVVIGGVLCKIEGAIFGAASGVLMGVLIGAICDAMTTIRRQIEGGARCEAPAAELGWVILSVVGGLIGAAGALWGVLFGMLFGTVVGSLVGALVIIRKQAGALEERPVMIAPARLQAIRDSGIRPLPASLTNTVSA